MSNENVDEGSNGEQDSSWRIVEEVHHCSNCEDILNKIATYRCLLPMIVGK